MTDLENREAFERAFKKEHSGVSFWLNTWDDAEQDYNHLIASWAWRMWQASAQREGYKLVPVEINDEIESAMFSSVARGEMPCDIYKAMIGAQESTND